MKLEEKAPERENKRNYESGRKPTHKAVKGREKEHIEEKIKIGEGQRERERGKERIDTAERERENTYSGKRKREIHDERTPYIGW